jgi:hypothetical protein
LSARGLFQGEVISYGLTQEQFDRLLNAQRYACGMCHEPFEDRELIYDEHDCVAVDLQLCALAELF